MSKYDFIVRKPTKHNTEVVLRVRFNWHNICDDDDDNFHDDGDIDENETSPVKVDNSSTTELLPEPKTEVKVKIEDNEEPELKAIKAWVLESDPRETYSPETRHVKLSTAVPRKQPSWTNDNWAVISRKKCSIDSIKALKADVDAELSIGPKHLPFVDQEHMFIHQRARTVNQIVVDEAELSEHSTADSSHIRRDDKGFSQIDWKGRRRRHRIWSLSQRRRRQARDIKLLPSKRVTDITYCL